MADGDCERMSFLTWLQEGPFAWVSESAWGYPIVLSAHAVGMSIIVGTVTMISLRVLGFARTAPIWSLERMSLVAWLGVTVNALSGIALFGSDAPKFFFHPVFWIKITLIALGAVSVWRLLRLLKEAESTLLEGSRAPASARLIAASSLVLWLGALVAGRLIAYTNI
jgi:hypothetical protein